MIERELKAVVADQDRLRQTLATEMRDTVVRLEWYPRMDVLVEVEGNVEAIECAAAVLELARTAYSADALAVFVQRFEARTGRAAAVCLARLDAGELPSWEC